MLESLFKGVFSAAATISLGEFVLCIAAALLAGIVLALGYMYRNRYTKSFILTIALLPAVVCVVIMMVNGNVGAGVAVAGAFSLVRFRSVPGTAREISMLFVAMGSGLIAGMGYLGFCLVFALIMCFFSMLYSSFDFGVAKRDALRKTLRITIPEDLDYGGVFDDIFDEYTTSRELVKVKTTNMGSLYRLSYDIVLREAGREKEMIDALRCRNGNLEISISRQETTMAEL